MGANRLTLTDASGEKLIVSYSLQGDRLTLSVTGSDFIQGAQANGAGSQEVGFLQQMLAGHENTVLVRFVLERS